MSNKLQEYYESYHKKTGELGYTGDRHAMTSRFMLFKEQIEKHVPKGGRILDIGCGSATFAAQSPDYEWHGIDWDIVHTKDKPITALVHNVEEFPYPYETGSFDAITCSELAEHIVHPIEIYKEVRRLLKREGDFFLSTPNHTWLVNLVDGFQNLIYDHRFSHKVEHIRTYDLESHKRCLAEAGMVVEDHYGADAHFCGILNPMAVGISKMISEKHGIEVPHWDIHLAMGKSHPHVQHTVFVRARKA